MTTTSRRRKQNTKHRALIKRLTLGQVVHIDLYVYYMSRGLQSKEERENDRRVVEKCIKEDNEIPLMRNRFLVRHGIYLGVHRTFKVNSRLSHEEIKVAPFNYLEDEPRWISAECIDWDKTLTV